MSLAGKAPSLPHKTTSPARKAGITRERHSLLDEGTDIQPGRIHMTEDKGSGGYIYINQQSETYAKKHTPRLLVIFFVTYCEQAFSLNAMTSEFTGAIIWSEQNDTVRPEDGDCQLACVECCYLTCRYPTEYPPSRERLWHRGRRPPTLVSI